MAVGLSWFFNRTRTGLTMTAVAEDHQVALSMGISVKRSIAFAWVLGCLLSTLGAVIFLSGKSLNFLASEIGFAALPVALLAGLESIGGLLLAGVIVGVIQGLATAYLDPLGGRRSRLGAAVRHHAADPAGAPDRPVRLAHDREGLTQWIPLAYSPSATRRIGHWCAPASSGSRWRSFWARWRCCRWWSAPAWSRSPTSC